MLNSGDFTRYVVNRDNRRMRPGTRVWIVLSWSGAPGFVAACCCCCCLMSGPPRQEICSGVSCWAFPQEMAAQGGTQGLSRGREGGLVNQRSQEHCREHRHHRHTQHAWAITAIPPALTDICVVLFQHGLVAVRCLLLVRFPPTGADDSLIASYILVDFSAEGCIWEFSAIFQELGLWLIPSLRVLQKWIDTLGVLVGWALVTLDFRTFFYFLLCFLCFPCVEEAEEDGQGSRWHKSGVHDVRPDSQSVTLESEGGVGWCGV